MRTNGKRRTILAVIAILVLLFIWGQSLLSVSDSATESGWLRDKLVNPMLRLIGLGPISNRTVRKLAHVAEFFMLSLFTTLFMRGRAAHAFLICFAVAFLDETIQLLSRRGASVRDVWIDLIGTAIGTALGWAITRRKRKTD